MGELSVKKTSIREIYKNPSDFADKTVTVAGWIRNLRDSKTFGFIALNDGSYLKNLQIVFDSEKISGFREIASQNIGAALSVSGTLLLTPGAGQPFEIQAEKIEILGKSSPDYPIQNKRHSFEFLRTLPHMRARTNTFSAVFRLRAGLSYAIHKFFNERGFLYVHTPIITGSDCEGVGEMFRVTTLDLNELPLKDGKADYSMDFFGKSTNLTVSGQLEAETFAMAFGNVYTFGPTFRSENSNTPRHAAEFWMIEPEMAFADLDDNMELAEDLLKYMIDYCFENHYEELEFFNSFIDKGLIERLKAISEASFARVTYTEAVKLLCESGKEFEYPVSWGIDLQTEHERYLTEEIFKKPVFVTDYPREIKAFYMRLNDDGKTVAAMDLLVPGVGEIIGGSQREERLSVLEKRIEETGMDKEEYSWYLDTRRYGSNKHAGFGLGFERAIMYFSGMQNIRDVLPFPRTSGSLY